MELSSNTNDEEEISNEIATNEKPRDQSADLASSLSAVVEEGDPDLVEVALAGDPALLAIALTESHPDILGLALTQSRPDLLSTALTQANPDNLRIFLTAAGLGGGRDSRGREEEQV